MGTWMLAQGSSLARFSLSPPPTRAGSRRSSSSPFPRPKHDGYGGRPQGASTPTKTPLANSISHGSYATPGDRAHMEDVLLSHSWHSLSLFACFDGHHGARAAKYSKQHLPWLVIESMQHGRDHGEALQIALQKLDEQWLKEAQAANMPDGCTAIAALILPNRLFIANIGDSRAVLCRNGVGEALSEDHNPTCAKEATRIQLAGGRVDKGRVNGKLGVARAIGDLPFKNGMHGQGLVSAEADIKELELTWDVEFIILASDGVWGSLSNAEAVNLCRMNLLRGKNPQQVSKLLVEAAIANGSRDNCSALIVQFKFGVKQGLMAL